MATAANKSQPLFFQNPVPLNAEKHAKSGLAKDTSFKFAKDTNSVPVNAQEFAFIAKTYPIVFTSDDTVAPVAVVGLENQKNVFVNAAGEWEKNSYIPAYVRRYPFAFTGVSEDKLILCVDESSKRFKESATKSDDKFFDGKDQTDLTKSALQYCADFHRDQKITLKFAADLKEKGLFVQRQITANVPGRKEPVVLGGFNVIDETKINQLDDATILAWFKNGYASLINFHFQSMSNWQNLVGKIGSK